MLFRSLHSRDNLRLIDILRLLRDQGNTVLVVEHDADMIKVADHIVDLGLGAGEQGGRIVFNGTLDGLMHEPRSLTAKYLRGELAIPVPQTRRKGMGQFIRLTGARERVPRKAYIRATGYENPAFDRYYASFRRSFPARIPVSMKRAAAPPGGSSTRPLRSPSSTMCSVRRNCVAPEPRAGSWRRWPPMRGTRI